MTQNLIPNAQRNTQTQQTSQQEMYQTIQEQNDRIRMIEARMKLIEEQCDKHHKSIHSENYQGAKLDNEPGAWQVKPQKPKPPPKLIQAPKIDIDGNPEEVDNSSSRLEDHPLDFVPVKMPKRRWEKRPVLTETMDEHVAEQLNKHIEEKYRGENPPKTRKQKEMTPDQRKEQIQKMLDYSGYKLGIAPLELDHIKRVEANLTKKGLFKRTDTPEIKRQKTVKSLLRTWSIKYLKMTDAGLGENRNS